MNNYRKSIHSSLTSVTEKMARKRVMKGGFFSSVYKKFQRDRIADCKDWVKKQQKKRKMKGGSKGSQTGSGGAYALSKLIGRGKNKRKRRTRKKR